MNASLASAVLPVYVIVLAGALLRWTRLLPRGAEDPLTRLTVNLLLPCLILDKMCGNAALRETSTIVWAASLGFLGVVLGGVVAYFAGRFLVGLQQGGGLRTFAMTTGLQNYGFVAIPVLIAVFPGDEALGVLFLHNLGVELAIWSFGLMLLRGSVEGVLRLLANGPILAVLLGLVLVKTGLDGFLPGVLLTALNQLGACAIPVALVLIGLTMAELAGRERPSLRLGLASVVLRLGVLAAMLLAAARFLPLTTELKQVLVIQAAMPAAVFPIVLARHYGGQPGVAIQVVLATGLVSVFTIPWVVGLGMRWVFGAP